MFGYYTPFPVGKIDILTLLRYLVLERLVHRIPKALQFIQVRNADVDVGARA
jgi:hypothetical protein